jgi:hypothetical protein
MSDQLPRNLFRMVAWSGLAAVLFFFWRAVVPHKIGVFFLGSATMSLYMTGALGLAPACVERDLEERLVRTSISAGANLLISLLFGLVFLGIGLVFYIAGLSDPENAVLFFVVLSGISACFFLFFWPALATEYFLDWPTDVPSMYLAWQVWHLHPGLGHAFRVATGNGIFFGWGILGSLCSMAQWVGLFYVSGIFQPDDAFPNLFLCMVLLLLVFPALSAAIFFLSYQAFSRILPQHILHPQTLPPHAHTLGNSRKY